jgi:hypothetical protein
LGAFGKEVKGHKHLPGDQDCRCATERAVPRCSPFAA